jgi:ABC-type transport system involved in cytochrome c biogenesis permease subunit
MLAVLREISVTCFFTSYLVVLVLELLRLLGRIPGRGLAVIVMMAIGLFTHVCYLSLRAIEGPTGDDVGLLATWSDWSYLLALGLAVCFLVLYLRRPDTIISFFFLPAVLATIWLGVSVRDLEPFSRTDAAGAWGMVHGMAMMVGAGAVLFGFLAGVMYLVQSSRLKHKKAGSALRLPTLETLGRMNRRCLITSTIAVAIGVLAGIIMNLNRTGQVGWTDGGVLFSTLLFLWLVGTTALEFFYEPASRGRKAVYLTLASLGFLVLAMTSVLKGSHGSPDARSPAGTQEVLDNPISSLTTARLSFLLLVGGQHRSGLEYRDPRANRTLLSLWESRALARRGLIQIVEDIRSQHALPSPAATASDSPRGRVKSETSDKVLPSGRACSLEGHS